MRLFVPVPGPFHSFRIQHLYWRRSHQHLFIQAASWENYERGVSQIKIDVQDEKKLVCIWLTRAESAEADIRESLKPLYGEYKSKKYFIVLYRSGEQDLREMTGALLRYNRKRLAEREAFAEKEASGFLPQS